MAAILVTGIGGVVGQGILKNIRNLKMDHRIVGTNIESISAGNHLCDIVYQTPFAYEPNYIQEIITIIEKESVELIIPSTDYETFYLAENQNKLNCKVAASASSTTKFCLDKYLTFLQLEKYGIPFAKSYLPSKYNNEFEHCIIKPREGRGSRGIIINPENPKLFDDSFLIQELLEGDEITTTFYINKVGKLHGIITFKRELYQGNTSMAEVTQEHDSELQRFILKLINHYEFRGSCNLQSKVTPSGIVPFEINCRISGTNSLRSQFGFNDVEYTLNELLLHKSLEKPVIKKGTAMRYIVDIIYPEIAKEEIKDNGDNFYINC